MLLEPARGLGSQHDFARPRFAVDYRQRTQFGMGRFTLKMSESAGGRAPVKMRPSRGFGTRPRSIDEPPTLPLVEIDQPRPVPTS